VTISTWFRDAPIRSKLNLIGLLTAAFALFAVSLVLIVRDTLEWRSRTLADLTTYAHVTGINAASAVVFNDPAAAAETLAALAAKPDIVHAAIRNEHGNEFASYSAPGHAAHAPPAIEPGGYRFTYESLTVSAPIRLKGEALGVVTLESDLAGLYAGVLRSAGLTILAAFSVFLLVLYLFRGLQRAIVTPILDLVGVMGRIAQRQDYTQRATAGSRDEIGALAGSFNSMIEGIQARDAELARQREHLEEEVGRRTLELREANLLLEKELAERKRAEQGIRDSEERHRGIFESAKDIIYLLDTKGAFVSLSPCFADITGWTVAKWIGRPFTPIIHPDDQSRAIAVFQRALAGEATPAFDLRIARQAGDYFDAELNITPLGGEAVTGAVGIARDVSERKRADERIRRLNEELEEKVQERTRELLVAQEELVRKEKLAVLGQVAGSVGHELRNPLGVMSNAVYFLQTVLTDADETTREYLGIIKDEIGGAERIVADLLDSVRTKPPRPEAVGVQELIERILRKLTVPGNVSIRVEVPVELPRVRVDPLQMGQVFRNLMANGLDAMPEGGTLEIHAEPAPDLGGVVVRVRDTGIGMTAEQLARLFQPLFTTKARGIGLGLVVVKNLTQANGGSVAVTSEAGKGTVFSITLPSAEAGGDIA
jgi:PAS domain S-box-containing protein